jgi:hypothetical protein
LEKEEEGGKKNAGRVEKIVFSKREVLWETLNTGWINSHTR